MITMKRYEEWKAATEEYEKVFGEGSLEKVIEFIFDPQLDMMDEEDFRDGIDKLMAAISKRIPLPQMSDEEFETYYF